MVGGWWLVVGVASVGRLWFLSSVVLFIVVVDPV